MTNPSDEQIDELLTATAWRQTVELNRNTVREWLASLSYKTTRRCGWFGEGRGQCLFPESHKEHHTCEEDGRLLVAARSRIAQLEAELAGRAAHETPAVIPRRPYDDDKPDGYLESDRDYMENNREAAVYLLDRAAQKASE